MRTGRSLVASVIVLALGMVHAPLAAREDAGESLQLFVNYRFDSGGGNEIDFDRELVYVGQFRGPDDVIRAFRVRNEKVSPVADIPCGGHNDMAILDDGYMAISFQGAGLECGDPGGPGSAAGAPAGGGVQVIDVSNPHRPRYHGHVEIPGGTHTLTRVPGAPYVYASLGGGVSFAPHGGDSTSSTSPIRRTPGSPGPTEVP